MASNGWLTWLNKLLKFCEEFHHERFEFEWIQRRFALISFQIDCCCLCYWCCLCTIQMLASVIWMDEWRALLEGWIWRFSLLAWKRFEPHRKTISKLERTCDYWLLSFYVVLKIYLRFIKAVFYFFLIYQDKNGRLFLNWK